MTKMSGSMCLVKIRDRPLAQYARDIGPLERSSRLRNTILPDTCP